MIMDGVSEESTIAKQIIHRCNCLKCPSQTSYAPQMELESSQLTGNMLLWRHLFIKEFVFIEPQFLLSAVAMRAFPLSEQ